MNGKLLDAGCSIMTSSQIQDGRHQLMRKSICLSEKWSDYNEIWYTGL